MNITKFVNLYLTFIIISITLLICCDSIAMEFPIQSHVIAKIPLRAGLYIDKKFKDIPIPQCDICHTKNFSESDLSIKFIEALNKGIETMTDKAFREVVIVDQLGPVPKEVNVLIIPEIDFIGSYHIDGSTAPVKIKMKWTIKDINGKVLYMNTFIGEGIRKKEYRYGFPCYLAIEDQLNKAFNGITESKWWEAVATHRD
jgi:hypothetical protein